MQKKSILTVTLTAIYSLYSFHRIILKLTDGQGKHGILNKFEFCSIGLVTAGLLAMECRKNPILSFAGDSRKLSAL